jgi:hypothetical protein
MKKSCAVDVSKNCCHACIHLEWIDAEAHDPSGYVCNGREYKTNKAENDHLKKLESILYRARPKTCCERADSTIRTINEWR